MTQIGIEYLSKFCNDNFLMITPDSIEGDSCLFSYRARESWKIRMQIQKFLEQDWILFRSKDNLLSYEANIILNLIRVASVQYKLEYSFNDLKGKKDQPLRFDFAIFDETGAVTLIEYDSLLHFQRESSFVKDAKGYHERDRKKNNYCLAHGIKLYRISVWDLDDIREYKDLFNDKFLVKTQWHNDNIMRQKNLL